jgi:hypothetical protein
MQRTAQLYLVIVGLAGLGLFFILHAGDRLYGHVSPFQTPRATHAGTPGVLNETPSQGELFVTHLQESAADPLSRFFLQLFAVITVSYSFGWVFTRYGQPAVVGEMMAGVVLGPSLFGLVAPGAFEFVFAASALEPLRLLSQVGVCLFMFAVGMELDVSQLKRQVQTAIVVSHSSIVIPYLLGVTLALFLFQQLAQPGATFAAFALFMGISMSITAFPVLVRILKDRKIFKTALGSTATACAAVDDVTAWIILAFVIAISRANSVGGAAFSFGLVIVFVSIMLLVIKPNLPKWLGQSALKADQPGKVTLAVVLGLVILVGSAAFLNTGGVTALMAHHDEGEPFSWIAGVSIWPSQCLRLLAVILCVVFLVKGSRDLVKNSDQLSEEFRFRIDQSHRSRFTLRTFWTNLQRVYHSAATRAALTVDQSWSWYLDAARPLQRTGRVLVLSLLYGAIMFSLDHWVLDEEMIHPCRGWLSCHVDWIMALSTMTLVVLLNLAVFDEVMLCRRWISWVSLSSGGWSEQVQQEYLSEYGLSQNHKAEFEKLKYLAGIDLISRRTEAVNRLIRYPFIALLIMIAARNDYFDIWNYPLVLLLAWALNVVLALSGALLLYRSADRAKQGVLAGLSKQMIQALGLGKDHEIRAKQVQ